LYFWFGGVPVEKNLAIVSALDFSEIIVSLDLGEPLIWALANRFPVTAVQCDSILRREYLDIAKYLPFTKIFLRDEVSEEFLRKAEFSGEISRLDLGATFQKFPETNKVEILRGLGLADEDVTVIVYEPQCEWAFRRWLYATRKKAPIATNKVAVFVSNDRDKEILQATCPYLPYSIVDDQIVLTAADHIIVFRYHEEISRRARCPVSVLDVFDRFRSKDINPQ